MCSPIPRVFIFATISSHRKSPNPSRFLTSHNPLHLHLRPPHPHPTPFTPRPPTHAQIRSKHYDPRDLYLRLDHNLDGTLDESQLQKGLSRCLGVELTDEETTQVQSVMSRGGEKAIDYNCFIESLESGGRPGPTGRSSATKNRPAADAAPMCRETEELNAGAAMQNMQRRRKVEEDRATSNLVVGINEKLGRSFGSDARRIRRLFLKLRTNGDGTVTRENLRAGFRTSLRTDLNDKDFGRLLTLCGHDASSSGTGGDIHFTDLVHALDSSRDNSGNDGNHARAGAAAGAAAGTGDRASSRKVAKAQSALREKLDSLGLTPQDVFLRLDVAKDGFIPGSQLRSGLRQIGIQLPSDQVDTLVNALTSTEKGAPVADQVNLEHFVASVNDKAHAYSNGWGDGGGHSEGPLAHNVGSNVAQAWESSGVRREHRGQLSIALTGAGSPLKSGVRRHVAAPPGDGGWLAHATAGGTGAQAQGGSLAASLTADQRRTRAMLRRINGRLDQHRSTMRGHFMELDQKRRGFITYDQFRNQLGRLGVDMQDGEFKLLTGRIDKNGDGRISYNEFARSMK